MEEEQLLGIGESFSRANAETAMELRECTVLLQLQTLQENVAAFNARGQGIRTGEQNLGSTTNIEVISMLEVCSRHLACIKRSCYYAA